MIQQLYKYQGCLVGFIVGNIIGKPFYKLRLKEIDIILKSRKNFKYNNKIRNCSISDDLEPSIILLRSLIVNKDYITEDILNKFYLWNNTCPLCITSNLCSCFNNRDDLDTILRKTLKCHYNNSNGFFLLRIVPIALFNKYKNITEIYKIIEEQTKLTNPVKYCIEISNIFFKILTSFLNNNIKKNEVIDNISKDIIYPENKEIFNNVFKSPIYIHNKLELETNSIMKHEYFISLKSALFVFLNNNNFIKGLKKMLSLGGNTIVNVSLYGALFGSYYGIKNISEKYRAYIILNNNDRVKKIKDIRINDSYILGSILCNNIKI